MADWTVTSGLRTPCTALCYSALGEPVPLSATPRYILVREIVGGVDSGKNLEILNWGSNAEKNDVVFIAFYTDGTPLSAGEHFVRVRYNAPGGFPQSFPSDSGTWTLEVEAAAPTVPLPGPSGFSKSRRVRRVRVI